MATILDPTVIARNRLNMVARVLCLSILWAVAPSSQAASYEVEVPSSDADAATATCTVTGLSESTILKFRDRSPKAKEWRDWFSVHVVQDGKASMTSIGGKYVTKKDRVVFSPRFPFRPGVSYVARVQLPGQGEKLFPFALKKPESKAAIVAGIYPSADAIHENHLRFYIQFSKSIARGAVYDHIELRDHKGNVVADPFLTLDEELWDPEQRRLTLFFDPGRVKRELLPRQELGPAIIAGRTYSLHVLKTLKDANGHSVAAFSKRYKILEPDSIQPNQKRWQLAAPRSGDDSVSLRFDESLDWGLLNRVLTVFDDSDKEVAGQVRVGKDERSWSFHPTKPWSKGQYEIRIDTRLEDPAGNSIAKPFEVDLLRPVEKRIPTNVVTLSFVVR